MLTVTVGKESFTLTDGQVKAINVDFMDITEYVKNMLTMKAWQQAHKIVLAETDKNPRCTLMAAMNSVIVILSS